ncbi:MAG TPA: hypothetical protein PKE03_03880 [Bacteroidales bacterium]|nr:hypothetical protein [Bacteroidales bacterium]
MEDLIYVLIALLWIVFSVVKSRPKQVVKPAADDEPRQKTPWEQMLEELIPAGNEEDDEENPPVKTQLETPIPAEYTPEKPAVSPFGHYNTFDYQGENTIQEIISLEDDIAATSTLAQSSIGDFDRSKSHQYNPALLVELRRAIVYNAILERPTW